jgi:hypothetical protein
VEQQRLELVDLVVELESVGVGHIDEMVVLNSEDGVSKCEVVRVCGATEKSMIMRSKPKGRGLKGLYIYPGQFVNQGTASVEVDPAPVFLKGKRNRSRLTLLTLLVVRSVST